LGKNFATKDTKDSKDTKGKNVVLGQIGFDKTRFFVFAALRFRMTTRHIHPDGVVVPFVLFVSFVVKLLGSGLAGLGISPYFVFLHTGFSVHFIVKV